MKTFSIGRKLLVSYSVILALMCIGFGVGIVNLVNLNSKMKVFYEGPFVVNESANIINSNFERMQKATYRTIVNTDEDIIKEAKANALPLVSFDIVCGPREIIRDGEDGKLIPPYDTEKMAETIYELLKKPEERLRLSNNSRSNLESFSKETILSEWKELIEQFVNPSR